MSSNSDLLGKIDALTCRIDTRCSVVLSVVLGVVIDLSSEVLDPPLLNPIFAGIIGDKAHKGIKPCVFPKPLEN